MYYLKQKIAERDEQWKQDYQLQSKWARLLALKELS